ncbi:MAG TPA: hypothetical protein VF786_09855, partial [Terriglobales bacterium]
MNRRHFVKTASFACASLAVPGFGRLFADVQEGAAWRTFEVITHVEVLNASGPVKVWVPAALIAETPFQRTLSNKFDASGGTAELVSNKADGLGIIAANFPADVKPVLTVTSRIAARDLKVDFSRPGKARKASATELQHFLRPTKLLPTDGIV